MRISWVLLFCSTPLTQALLRFKLQQWFPQYEPQWLEAVEVCQDLVNDYFTTNRTRCPYPCACAADCILQNITGTMQSNFASAQVLLGLTPATLTLIGPTIEEVAALSTYRPLLTVLLALGSPAINISRLFRGADIRELFSPPVSTTSRQWSAWLARQNRVVRARLHALAYVFALGALAINVQASVYTDIRTISGWRCAALFMPLVWSLLAGVVHAWGIVAVRLRTYTGSQHPFSFGLKSDLFKSVSTSENTVLSDAILWFASLCAIIHLTFGVFELSSLVFISALEALNVFIQYAASAVICQFILLSELANMRYELSQELSSNSTPVESSDSKIAETRDN